MLGRNILWYNEETGQIIFFTSNNEQHILKYNNLKDVAVMNDRIYILTLETDGGEIIECDRTGTIVKKYYPPARYLFYRFPKMENSLSVICQGSISDADKFGRNDWNFVYNDVNECWEKESLSY